MSRVPNVLGSPSVAQRSAQLGGRSAQRTQQAGIGEQAERQRQFAAQQADLNRQQQDNQLRQASIQADKAHELATKRQSAQADYQDRMLTLQSEKSSAEEGWRSELKRQFNSTEAFSREQAATAKAHRESVKAFQEKQAALSALMPMLANRMALGSRAHSQKVATAQSNFIADRKKEARVKSEMAAKVVAGTTAAFTGSSREWLSNPLSEVSGVKTAISNIFSGDRLQGNKKMAGLLYRLVSTVAGATADEAPPLTDKNAHKNLYAELENLDMAGRMLVVSALDAMEEDATPALEAVGSTRDKPFRRKAVTNLNKVRAAAATAKLFLLNIEAGGQKIFVDPDIAVKGLDISRYDKAVLDIASKLEGPYQANVKKAYDMMAQLMLAGDVASIRKLVNQGP
jgi:hypothetical protein